MAVKLNAYVSFNGNAREAAEFYKSVFGGNVYMDTYENFAGKMPISDDDKKKIMHAYLKGDNDIELMFADAPSGAESKDGSQISLSLSGEDETLLQGYWDKLGDGGKVTMPLSKAPWGDTFGMVTDKFGLSWMVDITSAENMNKQP
jgi:PhnB protein